MLELAIQLTLHNDLKLNKLQSEVTIAEGETLLDVPAVSVLEKY